MSISLALGSVPLADDLPDLIKTPGGGRLRDSLDQQEPTLLVAVERVHRREQARALD